MLTILLDSQVAHRLAAYLRWHGSAAVTSNHWRFYAAHNRIEVDERACVARLAAGAGFDGSFELNFRGRSMRERLGQAWRTLRGRNDDRLHRSAFLGLWQDGDARLAAAARILGEPMTPQKILACQYFALLDAQLGDRPLANYLEIGAGSGYLAALLHDRFKCSVTIIDLPEILPLGFLFLHARFPDVPYVFPNELERLKSTQAPRFVFLTPDQAQHLGDAEFDLAVNTASFGEMLPQQIEGYFRVLRRVLRLEGLFFTVNREEKWMNDPSMPLDENRPGHGIAVRFDDYPWLPRDRDLLKEVSAIHARIQPQSPMRVRLCHLAAE